VDAAPASGSKYVNSATVNYSFLSPDSTTLNASANATNTLYSNSVVITPTISKTATSDNAIEGVIAVGNTIDYTITIKNTSATATIQNATLNDALPTGLTYKTGTLSVNNASSNDPLTAVTLGDITPSATTTVKFSATVDAAPASDSKYVNSATVNYSFLSPDSTTLNASVSATNTLYSNSVVITPTITKTSVSSNTIPDVAAIGDTIDYTITIENTSATATIQSATLNDALPSGLTYKSGTLTVNTIASTDPLTAVTLGDINPNSTTTVKFTATVVAAPASNSKYVNSATVSYSFLSPDSTTLNASANATNTVYSNSVIITPTIAKTAVSSNAIQGVAAVGDTINYTITIENTSATANIQNATLNDVLPVGLTYKTGTLLVNNNPSTDPLTAVNLGNINANNTTTVTFTVDVATAPASGSKYVNSATVDYEFLSPDSTTLNGSVTTTNTVYSNAIVITPTIAKTAVSSNTIQGVAAVGDTINYTITIENTSAAATLQNATLNDSLPSGLVYKSGTLSINGNLSTDLLSSITLGNIAPNSTTIVKFIADVATPPASGSKYINSATVNYSFLSPDSTTLNNSVSTTNAVYSNTIVITPTVTKSAVSSNAIPNIAAVGDTIDYTITIENTSNTATIQNATLNDTLPTGLTYKTGTLSVNNTASTDALSSVTLGNINPSTTTTVKFSATVDAAPTSGSEYINSATVNYQFLSPDNTPLNNSVTANNTVYSNNIIITPTVIKTANTSVVSIGNAVNYTITIENTDTSTTLTNITLTDALPTELSYVSNSLTVNSVPTTGSPITGISISNIAPSQTTTVRFSAIVTSKPASGTTYINSVAINYQFNSPAGTLSNTVNTTNTIYSSDVATTPNLTKTSNAVFADIGNTVTYTITFKNTSPLLTISTVTLKDTLPTGLSYKENSLIINGVPNSGSIVTGVTVTNIAPNETVTISFDALVTAAPTSNSKYINSINTNYTFVFPDGSNFTDTVSSTNNLYSPDVIVKPTLTLSVNKTEVSTGGTIDFTIIVSNPNTTTIENPILTDILQNGLSFITGTLEIDGTPSSNSLTTGISLPNMPQNSSHTITFSVKAISRPAPGTDYTNFATLTYSFQGPDGILNNTINSNIVTIVNTDVNINPIAFKDYSYKTYKNTSLKATLPIANLNNSPIIFTIVTPPANGFASIDQSKTFKYTPKVNFIGTDSFSVSLTNDTNGSSIFTINIVVSDFPSSLDSAIYCRK
ncbi:hypothetical protein Z955_12770, partial [Clostridium botulinum C/D str. DC5]